MTAVLVIGVWTVACMFALRFNHVCSTRNATPTPPAPVDELPDEPAWVWTQARVDAEFRAMTVLLSR